MPNQVSVYCVCVPEWKSERFKTPFEMRGWCVSVSSLRTESWGRRRLKVRWSLHGTLNTPAHLDTNIFYVCFPFWKSSARHSWSSTGTKKATSATKTWGSVWGQWATCQRRWSSSNWASRSVSGLEQREEERRGEKQGERRVGMGKVLFFYFTCFRFYCCTPITQSH